MKQRTIQKEFSRQGRGVHSGIDVKIRIQGAPVDTGIIFYRTDLPGHPEIHPHIQHVKECVRSTTIAENDVKICTAEHLLAAITGLQLHNLKIEINAEELPILDGSSRPWTQAFLEADIIEQEREIDYGILTAPVSITLGSRSLIALPYNGFKITCTSSDDHHFHTQHLSLDIHPETFIAEIAPARTFVFFEDIEVLTRMGLIQGGSLESALVIKGNTILGKEPLRFKDEFVRHKILDLIGDLALLGKPLKAHIIAVRPGHSINAQFSKKLIEHFQELASGSDQKYHKPASFIPAKTENAMDIHQILNLLPHRYPFLMIDRILEFNHNQELRAIKNISINEPFFIGHFPGQPIMPGVLQIEAMAQAAGILMIKEGDCENKTAYFMSCDKVKFRRTVIPGDQMEIHVKILKNRGGKIGIAKGQCSVDGKIVSSAELMFSILENRSSH